MRTAPSSRKEYRYLICVDIIAAEMQYEDRSAKRDDPGA